MVVVPERSICTIPSQASPAHHFRSIPGRPWQSSGNTTIIIIILIASSELRQHNHQVRVGRGALGGQQIGSSEAHEVVVITQEETQWWREVVPDRYSYIHWHGSGYKHSATQITIQQVGIHPSASKLHTRPPTHIVFRHVLQITILVPLQIRTEGTFMG